MPKLEDGGDKYPEPETLGEGLGEIFDFSEAGNNQPHEGGDQHP